MANAPRAREAFLFTETRDFKRWRACNAGQMKEEEREKRQTDRQRERERERERENLTRARRGKRAESGRRFTLQ